MLSDLRRGGGHDYPSVPHSICKSRGGAGTSRLGGGEEFGGSLGKLIRD